jgi:hypothetical protein
MKKRLALLHRWDNEFCSVFDAMPCARSKARTRNMKKRLASLHRWDSEFRTILNAMPRARSKARTRNMKKRLRYFIVGITNSAPSLTPCRVPAARRGHAT